MMMLLHVSLPTTPGVIPVEDVPGIDLVLHVVQQVVIAVGKDAAAEPFELGEVVDHGAAADDRSVYGGGLVDDDPYAVLS